MLKSAIRRRCLVAVLEFVTVGIDYRAFLSGSVKGGDSHKSSFLWVLFFVSVSLVFGTLSNWQIQNIIIKLKKYHFIRLYCYAFFHNPISRKFSFIFFKKGLTNSNRFVEQFNMYRRIRKIPSTAFLIPHYRLRSDD